MAHDHERALIPADHAIVDSTSTLRALIIDLTTQDCGARDLFTACAMLGHLIGERGGTPTLASSTIDGAAAALGGSGAWLLAARAALFEGYAAARVGMCRRDAARAWHYPHCVVRLDDATVAIVAGFPSDDGELIADWAARIAHGASMAGVRRAVVELTNQSDRDGASGAPRESARHALVDALQLAGIEVYPTMPPPRGLNPSNPRAWLPWRRKREPLR